MSARTSGRSSVNHNSASSPPKSSARRAQDLHARITRSQTREISSSELKPRQSAKKRGVRHAGVESKTSTESKGKRKRKGPAAPVSRELPMVVEEPVVVQSSGKDNSGVPDVAKHAGNAKDSKEDEQSRIFQSPGGLSTLSGTTILTSQPAQEIEDLDLEMIVKLLPALSRDAFQLVQLLLPGDVTPLEVEKIMKELQIPGSSRGKMLRYLEETFNITRKNFGSELFINLTIILRKMFNNQNQGTGESRPDAVLYAANTATLVKGLLVAKRDSPNTMPFLQRLDDLFPYSFLSRFEPTSQYGSSTLVNESFDFALELRTQTIISILMTFRGDPNYDPNQIIAQIFFEPPPQRNPSLNTYEDSMINGEFRKLGGSTESFSVSESETSWRSKKVHERVEAIRKSFNDDMQAIEDGDYVDFHQLHRKFPWLDFIIHAMKWSRLRLEEINSNLEAQGGPNNVATTLAEEIQGINNQIQLNYDSPRPAKFVGETKGSQLARAIIPASIGKSLYKSSKSVEALLKTLSSVPLEASSSQEHRIVTENKVLPITKSAGLKNQDTEGLQPEEQKATGTGDTGQFQEQYIEDTEPLGVNVAPRERSTAELLADLREAEAYQNKENRPLQENTNTPKRRFMDRQLSAQRIAWSQPSHESEIEPITPKGKKRNYQDYSDITTSEDEGFQYDDRVLDIPRRRLAQTARGLITDAQPPRKRARKQTPEKLEIEKIPKPSIRPDQSKQAEDGKGVEAEDDGSLDEDSTFRANVESTEEGNDEDGEFLTGTSAPSYAIISETAKEIWRQKQVGASRRTRQRIPWTEKDTELLINLIGDVGCSWATMEEKGDFEHTRDQVALKDKARNVKVDFLRARVELLPAGFDGIHLGRKERARVRAVGENPFRKEGERPGEESEGPESP